MSLLHEIWMWNVSLEGHLKRLIMCTVIEVIMSMVRQTFSLRTYPKGTHMWSSTTAIYASLWSPFHPAHVHRRSAERTAVWCV